MLRLTRSQLRRYGMAVASVALALLLTRLLLPLLSPTVFALFFAAVTFSAWYGGLGPGLAATVLSILALAYFLPPSYSLSLDLGSILRLGIFGLVSLTISSLNAELQAAKQRAEVSLFKLRQSEEQYRRIVETANEGIWVIDGELRTEYVNQRLAEMFGYSIQEMLGRPLFDFMDETARLEAEKHIERCKQGIKEQFDFRYRRKDGSDLWAIASATPILDEGGKFIGRLATLTDISDRKQAEQQLEESERRFRQLAENLQEVFWIADSTQPQILYISPAYERIWGRSCQSLYEQPQSFWENIHPSDREIVLAIEEQQKRGEPTEAEYRIVQRDGECRWIGDRRFPIKDNSGQVYRIAGIAQDISQHKHLQEALQESEKRYRTFFEQSSDGIWRFELEQPLAIASSEEEQLQHFYQYAYLAECNQVMAQMYGFSCAREIVGLRLSDFIPASDPNNIEYMRNFIRSDYRLGEAESQEVDRHGNSKYFLNNLVGIVENGTLVRAWGSQRDITDRKRTIEALQESENRFRTMADTAPVMIWMSGTDKLCNYFNKGWLDFSGRTVEQEMGNGWAQGIHSEDFQRCLDTYITAFDARENFKMEYRLRRFDGEYRWVLDAGSPRFTHEGNFVGYIGSCIDISDRKRSEELQHFLTEASTVLATSLDYETTLQNVAHLAVPYFADCCTIHAIEEDGSIREMAMVHADPAKAELLREFERRYPPDPQRSRGYLTVLRTGEPELISEFSDSVLTAVAENAEHLEMLRQLGLTSSLCVPLRSRGRILGAITFTTTESGRRYNCEDLTFAENLAVRAALAADNAKAYSRAKRDRAAAEQANRIKDEFLATLSHELRTPLNAILGWAQLLRDRALDEVTRAKALETIERNARSQAQLIDDILDVSRIITGKLRLNVRPFPANSVIEAAIEAVRPAADAKGIRLKSAIDPNAGSISGDPDRLTQVIWNLLSNAVKFTPQGGRVAIGLQRIHSHLEITVSDTGIGIPAEFLPHVFDRFSQADAGSNRKYGGLGLGLAIVRHLVEQHGGSVQVVSPGKEQGTTFSVYLPLTMVRADDDNQQQIRPTPPDLLSLNNSRSLQGVRVLVVDDLSDARELIATILTEFGARVTTVASAAEAIAAIAQSRPDVLLSDIEMPNEDGYTLIRQVRALDEENQPQIPAAALTAYARAEDRRRALLAGYQIHIAKPVEPAELAAAIANLAGLTGNI